MRKVLGVLKAPAGHWVGDGFPVQSLFSPADSAHLSPFLLLDYATPRQFDPATRPRGVGVHPHRGFETVTIVYQGEVAHRDSTGKGGVIGAGDVQWMTAAGGILHEEFHSEAFTRAGGTFEVAQLWVNLPAKDKLAAPGYQSIVSSDIETVDLADGAGTVRVIAGEFEGHKGPAHTFTPLNVWDARLTGAAGFTLPEGHTLALVVLAGKVTVNGGAKASDGEVVVFERTGGKARIEPDGEARLLVLSGEPIDEPVVSHGPFVMNSEDEIRAAITDYRSGRFGQMAA
ncbi:MAG: pirin family protein [Caulobacteraceae bacterium]